LRQEIEQLGSYTRDFVIFDANDQQTVVKQILLELNLDPKRYTSQAVHGAISNAKNELIPPAGFHSKNYWAEIVGRVYRRYEEVLQANNALDFDDLIMKTHQLFSRLPEARMRGYGPGRFSFNVKGGRCEPCRGEGVMKIEMHFLPDVYVPCRACDERRYNRETLDVRFRGRNVAECLAMTVSEALAFFERIPSVSEKLRVLNDVGLGYIRLGQAATTLSGGEAQRIKLAKELGRRATGRTLYILDEPTTGLHFADIQKLLDVLKSLSDAGNTIVIIEHTLDVVKFADHVIDLGPEGGDDGGRIVATGTPEEVAGTKGSYTGMFLKEALAGRTPFAVVN